jgi:hypothetical protein
MNEYMQAALNMIPVMPSIPDSQPERFYQAVMHGVTAKDNKNPLSLVDGNEHKTEISLDSLSRSSIAAYCVGGEELRWTSAYLLSDSVRPSNLDVAANATVEKVLLVADPVKKGQLRCSGLVVHKVKAGTDANHPLPQREVVALRLAENGEVVLTGGSLGTVGILQRSGVGYVQLAFMPVILH